MGDLPLDSASDARNIDQDHSNTNTGNTGRTLPNSDKQQTAPDYEITQPQHHPMTQHHTFSTQFDMSHSPSVHRPNPYNMGQMANSLPHGAYRPGHYPQAGQARYPMPNSPSMMHQMPQFVGPQAVPIPNQGYYIQQPHMGQYYGGHYAPSQTNSPIPPRQTMAYYPNQMVMNQQSSPYYYTQTPHYPHSTHAVQAPMMLVQHVNESPVMNDPRAMPQPPGNRSTNTTPPEKESEESERRQSAVRGPPRKPRQSGHAIWIGNLPPQTELMKLVHHVCKEAAGLESLFLISKSNCAFANFKDEETCIAAQQKLHDSKFQSVRLVSRLRKSTVEGATGVTAPTGPAIASSTPILKNDTSEKNTLPDAGNSIESTEKTSPNHKNVPGDLEVTSQRDKFFILKSLTVEDLDLSVRTGIWATQSHNEETLNQAFKASDNVYLVFSANKSGEYFGYARMISEINEDPTAAIEFAPKTPVASDLDLPKAIPTEATEHAPQGRIIDDSARGTIFWEAERDETDIPSDAESVSSEKSTSVEEGSTKTWGKPFKLEWLSTTHLPFYRTRGLRNPWNSNREVKIARDGTELEPSVGRKLIGLFNRVQSPGPNAAIIQVPMATMPGFSQARPYGQQ